MSDMKTIMENWNKFSNQKDEELLEEGFKENLLFALSLFAGGSGIVYSQMNNNDGLEQEQLDNAFEEEKESKSKLNPLPKISKLSAKSRVINFLEGKYKPALVPAPSQMDAFFVEYGSIEDNHLLPMVNMSARDYRSFLEDNFSIVDLERVLYSRSSGGTWGYNIDNETQTPFHVINGKPVLPPSWSIMYEIFQNKTYDAIDNFEKAVDSPDERLKIVKTAGFSSVDEFNKELERLKNIIGYE
jgi:hypothetical protein